IYNQNNDSSDTSWNNGVAVAQITNPMSLFTALFGNFSPGTVSQDAINTTARRLQSLKQVQSSLKKLQDRLPSSSSSYSALQTHLAAAQGLSAQLSSSNAAAGCAPPVASSIPDDNGSDYGTGPDPSLLDAEFNAYIQMTVQGFACDLT